MIGAIDVGSNAVRMVVAEMVGHRRPKLVVSIREPIRLGRDVFATGVIAEETTERAIEAFKRFRKLLDAHHVRDCRAVATSALREARNREMVIARIADATGIQIDLISGEEEARLVYLAVASRINLKKKRALLIDMGGGSVETVVVADGQIAATDSFRMGAVRLLQELEQSKAGERRFNRLVREYVDATRKRLKKELGNKRIELCVATGGSPESLGDLRRLRLHKDNGRLAAGELKKLVGEMQSMTFEERVRKLGLRPDRADVIIPAGIVLQRIMKQAGAREILIPHVGLKDGLLLDVLQKQQQKQTSEQRDQALRAAMQLGVKYKFDKQHGLAVARYATQLFDETRPLHDLDGEHRFLLEVAALLHEVGNYVAVTGHHKHSFYLIANSALIGLTDPQRAIVANVARYHRKATPNLTHEPYRSLSPKERVIVTKLAALVRVADALDREHGGKVTNVEIKCRPPKLTLRLRGKGDLLLEQWAVAQKSELFEETFGVKVMTAD